MATHWLVSAALWWRRSNNHHEICRRMATTCRDGDSSWRGRV